jgi:GTP-binding protein HflX
VIALVGYTNAGKSTLFNRMTGAAVMAEDLLFATLDPTMRAITLPGVEKAILSDTVGFISDLPTQLVAAFRATLEEVTAADVIVHVRDMANPAAAAQKAQVLEILTELAVIEGEGGESRIPIVEAWNKWDLLGDERKIELEPLALSEKDVVPISAVTGFGLGKLSELLGQRLTQGARTYEFVVPAGDGQRIAWLHAHGEVLGQAASEHGAGGPQLRLKVRLTPLEFGRYSALAEAEAEAQT